MSRTDIDTEAMGAAAMQVKGAVGDLVDALEGSRSTIRSLGNAWTGRGSRTAVEAFLGFEAQQLPAYRDALTEYVTYLEGFAAPSYEAVERTNTSKADQI